MTPFLFVCVGLFATFWPFIAEVISHCQRGGTLDNFSTEYMFANLPLQKLIWMQFSARLGFGLVMLGLFSLTIHHLALAVLR